MVLAPAVGLDAAHVAAGFDRNYDELRQSNRLGAPTDRRHRDFDRDGSGLKRTGGTEVLFDRRTIPPST